MATNAPDGAAAPATCRACGAGLVPGLNPRYCEPCLSRIPVPFGDMAWQARLAGRLHGLTGGETPAVFRCLVDAAAPVLPLMVGAREALVARWPGAKRTAHDAAGWWLHSYGATCGYLSALARGDSMRFDLDGRPVAPVSGRHRARAAALRESPWVSGTRADREAHEEALARSGRCSWVGGRCMVEADGGPMGRLRVEMPGFMCGRPARAASVAAGRFTRFRRTGEGLWDVVGLDRRGVERYRVTGYGSEDEASGSLEFHPRETALVYEVRYAGAPGGRG